MAVVGLLCLLPLGCETAPPVSQTPVLVVQLSPEDLQPGSMYETIERRWAGGPFDADGQERKVRVRLTVPQPAGTSATQAGTQRATVTLSSRSTEDGPGVTDDSAAVDGQGQALARLTVREAELVLPASQVGGLDTVSTDGSRLPVDHDTLSRRGLITIDRPAMTLTLLDAAESNTDVRFGVARIRIDPDLRRAVRTLDGSPPRQTVLWLAMLGASTQDITILSSLKRQPSLEQAVRLIERGVSPEYLLAFDRGGYAFGYDAWIPLHAAKVDPQEAAALRELGYEMAPGELIAFRQAAITPESAAVFQSAGFGDDAGQVLRLVREGVDAAYAKEISSLGFDQEVDLLRLHAAGIKPHYVQTMQRARFDPSAAEFVDIYAVGVKADDALVLHRTGYRFSLEDLKKLTRYEVPTSYASSLFDEGFTPLGAEQIVDLWLRRVTPAMVRSLRRGQGEAPADPGNGAPLIDLK